MIKQFFNAVLVALLLVVGTGFVESSNSIALPLNSQLVAYDSEQINYSTLRESPEDNLQPAEAQAKDEQDGLKGALNTVREKLNLDQPIAPETKEFFGDVKEKVEDVTPGGTDASRR